MSRRVSDAVARTVPMPGVDLREQRDEAGPAALETVKGRLVGVAFCDHIALGCDARTATLCGIDLRKGQFKWGGGYTENACQACRVEASRLRVEIVR